MLPLRATAAVASTVVASYATTPFLLGVLLLGVLLLLLVSYFLFRDPFSCRLIADNLKRRQKAP